MLKTKISKSEFDELSTELQAEYKAGTGVDSDSYLLETDSTSLNNKVDEFRSNNIALKKQVAEMAAMAKKYKDIDPDAARAALSKVQELEDQKLLDEGDIEKLILNRTEGMRAKHDGQVKSMEKALAAANDDKAAMESRLSEILIDTSATNAVGALGNIRKGALPDVLSRARAKFKLVDGEPVAMNGKDIIYSAKNASEPMPITEWAESLAIEAPHLFEPSVGGGAKGSDVAPTYNVIMANKLDEILPVILAQGLLALRGKTVMPSLVNSNYENEAKEKGDTIKIPIPSAGKSQPVSPSNTPPVTADLSPTSVALQLDQWEKAAFYLSDRDMKESMRGSLPIQASEAVSLLAREVNRYVLSKYTGVYGYTGTAGTTPFAADTSDATNVRKILNNQLAPMYDRRVVLDPDAEANALNLRAFQHTSYRGDKDGIVEGFMGRKFGFDWYMNQQVPTHVAGKIVTGLKAKANTIVPIGDKSVTCTTAAGSGAADLKLGDIITFTGSSQTYAIKKAVSEGSANTDMTLEIEPGLVEPLKGGEVVNLKGTHVVNLGFHRDAFAFASRPLQDSGNIDEDNLGSHIISELGSQILSAFDPESGLSLRLELTRNLWSFDMLYGALLVRPELATRLAG